MLREARALPRVRSVTPAVAGRRDRIRCLECGRPFRIVSWSHLRSAHGYRGRSPCDAYRSKHGVKALVSPATLAAVAASFAATLERQGRRWSRERIVAGIRKMRRAGVALNQKSASYHDRNLYAASLRYFDRGWDDALRAAGLDPARLRKRTDYSHLTLEDAARWIRDRVRAGLGIRYSEVPLARYQFVRSRFPAGWGAFVESLGIRYPGPRPRQRPTDEEILADVRRLAREGGPLNSFTVFQRAGALWQRVRRRFGSWVKGLRRAGLRSASLETVPHRKPVSFRGVTLDDVARTIRERAAAGLGIGQKDVPRPLSRFVYRRYRLGWPAFVQSLGIRYPGRRLRGRLSDDEILEEIRQLARKGWPLDSGAVVNRACWLWHRARRRFGSWHEGLRRAGVDAGGGP